MKYIKEYLQKTIPYAASSSEELLIGPKSYWIAGMIMSVELAKSDGASPVATQDWMYRSITGLSLQGGGRPYLSVSSPDARALYWATRMRTAGRHRAPDMVTGTHTIRHRLPLLFGVNPIKANDAEQNRDATAAIAPDEDLSLVVNWSAAGSTTGNGPIGADMAIGAATLIRLTLLGLIPEDPSELPTWYPRWMTTQHAPDQAYAGLGDVVNLSTGYYYRRSTLMFLNGATTAPPADNRTDGVASDAISEIAVKTADGRYPVKMKVGAFTEMSQAQFGVADDNSAVAGATLAPGASVHTVAYNAGVGMIDWAEIADTSNPDQGDPLYGIKMIGKDVGTAGFAYTVDTSANTSVVAFHECYQKY